MRSPRRLRRPRLTAGMSTTPSVMADPKTLRLFSQILTLYPARVAEGQKLVILHVAGLLLREVQALAPVVSGRDYKQDLYVGLVEKPLAVGLFYGDKDPKPVATISAGATQFGVEVLQKELGLVGDQVSHWRPALRAVREMTDDVGQLFLAFLRDGDAAIFDVPEFKLVALSELEQGQWFQKKLG